MEEKLCTYCHSKYKKRVSSQVYCSSRCRTLYHKFARKELPHLYPIKRDTSEFELLREKIIELMIYDKSYDYTLMYTLRTIDLKHFDHIIPDFVEDIEQKYIKMKS